MVGVATLIEEVVALSVVPLSEREAVIVAEPGFRALTVASVLLTFVTDRTVLSEEE